MNINSLIISCLEMFQIALQNILKDTNLIQKETNVNETDFRSNSTRKGSRLNRATTDYTKQHLTTEARYQYAAKDESQVSQTIKSDQPKNVEIDAKKDELDVSQVTKNDQRKNVEIANWSKRKNIQGEKDHEQLHTDDIEQDSSELDFDTGTGKMMDINSERMQLSTVTVLSITEKI